MPRLGTVVRPHRRRGSRLTAAQVVVALKARSVCLTSSPPDAYSHLPNKSRVGKQDAYCTLTYGGRTARSPVAKRAGQTPEWDYEARFEVFTIGDGTDVRQEITSSGGVQPAKPSATGTPTKASKKRELKIAVFSDDARDPELIGDATVDLEATIKKGEFDGASDRK